MNDADTILSTVATKILGGDITEDDALEILENNGYIVELEKEQSNYQLGLHGQLDLEDMIASKKEGS